MKLATSKNIKLSEYMQLSPIRQLYAIQQQPDIKESESQIGSQISIKGDNYIQDLRTMPTYRKKYISLSKDMFNQEQPEVNRFKYKTNQQSHLDKFEDSGLKRGSKGVGIEISIDKVKELKDNRLSGLGDLCGNCTRVCEKEFTVDFGFSRSGRRTMERSKQNKYGCEQERGYLQKQIINVFLNNLHDYKADKNNETKDSIQLQ